MIETQEMLSQQAQMLAARDSELSAMNAARLKSWQAKYWYRCVVVPAPVDPPKWPALRSSIVVPASNVTPIKKAGRR